MTKLQRLVVLLLLPLLLPIALGGRAFGGESGPAITDDGILFSCMALGADQVFLAGSFNNWAPNKDLMTQTEDGLWQMIVKLPDGHHQYKFVVDGTWKHDPDNPATADDGYGGYNSVLAIKEGKIIPVETEPARVMPTRIAPPPKNPLYLAIIWHQHQPMYDRDPETRIYAKPWVRMHAVKDYYDMASILLDYPNVHATFNLVPSLIFQLDDLISGATDRYMVLSEKPAGELTPQDREFILRRFFDANWNNLIGVHPGYNALLDKRGRRPLQQLCRNSPPVISVTCRCGSTWPGWTPISRLSSPSNPSSPRITASPKRTKLLCWTNTAGSWNRLSRYTAKCRSTGRSR